MKKKKGRRIDHTWQFVKFKGDCAIYAHCSCGFNYPCYKNERNNVFSIVQDPEKLYNYCPVCGARKTKYFDWIVKIERYPWE